MSVILAFDLLPRENSQPIFYFGVLLMSLTLIAVARFTTVDIFRSVFIGQFRGVGVYTFLKDTAPLNRSGSILLVINYFITVPLLTHFILMEMGFDFVQSIWVSPLLVFGWFALNNISFLFISAITGEFRVFRSPFLFRLLEIEFMGILSALFALVYLVNPGSHELIYSIFLWTLLSLSVIRLIKSVFVSLRLGIAWYYIILYLCTLEILPLVVGFYWFTQNTELDIRIL